MQRSVRFGTSNILIVSSCILLVATAYLFITFGSAAYFAVFHKPFHVISFSRPTAYEAPALPHFTVTSSVASGSLSPGESQVITVTATPDRSVQGYIQVWIQNANGAVGASACASSCHGLNVYQNNTDGQPIRFVKDKSATYTYTYKLQNKLPAGTYRVSDIITSSDTFTDYSVHNNFAEFRVQ